MKKLLLTLVGVVSFLTNATEIFAQTEYTYGIHREVSPQLGEETDVDAKATGVSYSRGSFAGLGAMTDKDRTIYHGSSTKITAPRGVKNYRTSVATSYNEGQYYDFSLTIASGYAIDVKSITGDVAVDSDNGAYQMKIYNGAGDLLYECGAKGGAGTKSSASFVKTVDLTDEDIDISKRAKVIGVTGKLVVKMFVWNTGATGKYIDIVDFKVNVNVYELTQTQYSKPVITVGAYDQPSGTYAVTLNVQNDEDGAINYTVGSEEKVTGAADNTVLSVAPNTTIVATVSGSAYTESDEATLTTAAKPILATPTYSIGDYDFANNTYEVTISGPVGAKLYYSYDNWAAHYPQYTEAINVVAGQEVKARATQNNMTTSADLVFTVPVAPSDGSATTPTTASTYTSNVDFDLGAITVPGAVIAGQISSGSTPINGVIKTRCNQTVDAHSNCFYVTVNPGYVVTSISIEGCSNATGANTCEAVYVDGEGENVLASSVELPLAAKDGSTGTIAVADISAKQKIVFQFTQNYQGQMKITVNYAVSRTITLGSVGDNGLSTLSAPQNYRVVGGTAYKAAVSGDVVTLTEVTGIIPAGAGVIVVGEKGADVSVAYTSAEATADMSGNELYGTTSRIETPANCMALNSDEGKFQSYTGTYFPANKAYLVNGSSATLRVSFGEATAIKTVEAAKSNAVRYNLVGQRVNANAKGIIVVNGKKVMK